MFGESIGSPTFVVGFILFILAMLSLDLGVFHRKYHQVSFREAMIWSIVWVSLAMVFNLAVYYWFGSNTALVAPVKIGDGAVVGAGSTITNDVEADDLALSRPEQKNYKGAAAKLREKKRTLKESKQEKNKKGSPE